MYENSENWALSQVIFYPFPVAVAFLGLETPA